MPPVALLAMILLAVGCSSARRAIAQGSAMADARGDTTANALAKARGIMYEYRMRTLRRVAELPPHMFQTVAARLLLNIDTKRSWHDLDSLLANPTGDIFWMYPAAGFYFRCKNILEDTWRDRFRRALKSYTPYRGDTENHFLMYYSTILLFSQEWPNLTRDEWFNGKSSRENYAEAKSYIDHWLDETVREGTTEWDSPRYLYFYLTPLLNLYDFAADTTLKKRVGMMIEYQLADYAVEYLDGSYCGAHSRDGDNSVIDPRNSEARSYGEFYFDDSLRFVLPDLAYAAASGFELPPIIRDIAHARAMPYEHTELKRSRARMRFADERYAPVYKYDYITRDYALGSIQGGLQQPIQQHSWGITFAARKANNTIFGLHPQMSERELGTFFPEEPALMVQGIGATKGSYVSEDKWVGGSPYERIVQDSNILVALYRIDSSARFQHVDLFFPKTLDTIERVNGWIICRMDSAFVAIYPFNANYQWIDEKINWRLRMPTEPGVAAGYIVECGSAQDMAYEAFRDRDRTVGTTANPRTGEVDLTFTTGNGRAVLVADRAPGADGAASEPELYIDKRRVEHDRADLFNGPFLRSARGSGVLTLSCNGHTRVLDFNRAAIEER
jgi:hypothetical protein